MAHSGLSVHLLLVLLGLLFWQAHAAGSPLGCAMTYRVSFLDDGEPDRVYSWISKTGQWNDVDEKTYMRYSDTSSTFLIGKIDRYFDLFQSEVLDLPEGQAPPCPDHAKKWFNIYTNPKKKPAVLTFVATTCDIYVPGFHSKVDDTLRSDFHMTAFLHGGYPVFTSANERSYWYLFYDQTAKSWRVGKDYTGPYVSIASNEVDKCPNPVGNWIWMEWHDDRWERVFRSGGASSTDPDLRDRSELASFVRDVLVSLAAAIWIVMQCWAKKNKTEVAPEETERHRVDSAQEESVGPYFADGDLELSGMQSS